MQARPSAGCVAELVRDYAKHIDAKGGIGIKHKDCMKCAIRIARQTCGALPVADFGPLALQDVRKAMLAVRYGENDGKRWTRSVVNRPRRLHRDRDPSGHPLRVNKQEQGAAYLVPLPGRLADCTEPA